MNSLKIGLQQQFRLVILTLIAFIFVTLSYSSGNNHIISTFLFYVGCILIIGHYLYHKIGSFQVNENNYLNFCVKNLAIVFFALIWMPFAIIATFFSNEILVYHQLFLFLLAEIPIFFFIWWIFFDKERHDNYAQRHSVNIKGNHIEQIQLTQFSAGYSLGKWTFLRAPLKLLTGLGRFMLLILMMLGGGAGIVINQVLKATILQGIDIDSGAIIFFSMGCVIVPSVTYCILPLFSSIRWWEALKAEIKAQYGSVEVSLNLINPNQDLMDKQEELEFMKREKKRIKEEKRKSRDQKIYDWLNK